MTCPVDGSTFTTSPPHAPVSPFSDAAQIEPPALTTQPVNSSGKTSYVASVRYECGSTLASLPELSTIQVASMVNASEPPSASKLPATSFVAASTAIVLVLESHGPSQIFPNPASGSPHDSCPTSIVA